ncbi:enterotoxin [Silvibacterium acidisoli]|uniref:enterotoxin n=1 Tax=Acidobacteriaceae bacterium ZG23-2 TaxID=2883246 RepID=UPI00406CA40C
MKTRLLLAVATASLAFAVHAQTLTNKTLTAKISAQPQPLLEIDDTDASRSIKLPELFHITMKDGSVLTSSSMKRSGDFATYPAGPGKQICNVWTDAKTDAKVAWCLLSRPDDHHMRAKLEITAGGKDLPMTDVRLLDFADANAHVSGTVKGSPVVDDRMFFGFEHPLSWSKVVSGHVQAGMARTLPLKAGQSVTYSAVIGTAAAGQMRRDFLSYIEEERPRPYKPFLHYNSWYDIGYENRFSEADAIDRVHAYGTELVEKRHVKLDGFMFDDGWDDPNTLWGFDKGFPDGFTKTSQAAEAFHAGVGVWLSPWGGYAEQKQERVAYGKAHGLEIVKGGYALSGPKYFKAFEDVMLKMVDQYHVNQFKIDGTGNADSVVPGSQFDSDFNAALYLIHEVREKKPGIFINLTTGTYPSPFWLFDADSIWRGGEDHDFAGVGSWRQKWITYRDQETYRMTVQRGPLFPINSLMLHGMIYAKQARNLMVDPNNEFPEEVQSYFAGGTQLQEMYITPSLMNDKNWDTLAYWAKWSRSHSEILKDTHWIGGDPGKLEVYGWAAWAPSGWTITLRNPSDKPQSYKLDVKQALELPQSAPESYMVSEIVSMANGQAQSWKVTDAQTIALKPFEVRTFESQSSH